MYKFEQPGMAAVPLQPSQWCEITNKLGQKVIIQSGLKEVFHLLHFEGLGEVGTETQTVTTPRMDGNRPIETRLLPRSIQIILNLNADHLSKLRELREELSRVVNPRLSPFFITYQEPDMPIRVIEATCDKSPTYAVADARGFTSQRSSISFTANDPYWRSETKKYEMKAFDEAFGFPFSFPIRFGYQGQIATIVNRGHEASKPRVEIQGPADQPTIENRTTGAKFTLDRAIVVGETLVIDNQNRSVRIETQNGSINAAKFKKLGSTWIDIELGDNELQFTAVAGSSKGKATVFYYDRYVGI